MPNMSLGSNYLVTQDWRLWPRLIWQPPHPFTLFPRVVPPLGLRLESSDAPNGPISPADSTNTLVEPAQFLLALAIPEATTAMY